MAFDNFESTLALKKSFHAAKKIAIQKSQPEEAEAENKSHDSSVKTEKSNNIYTA